MGKKDISKDETTPETTEAEMDDEELGGVSGGLKYELTNVMVTSYSIGSSSDSDPLPMEQVSLNYAEVTPSRKK